MPSRSINIRPLSTEPIGHPRLSGMSTIPVAVAPMPSTFCIQSGKNADILIKIILVKNDAETENETS
ncbi:hypothetical protein SAMN05192557_1956 [Aliicoccus persicus]|uniref:Uncharacterized protein n=1 Tax=Aliicoccus persicus TaxID=930138 RepID=A0A662Z5K8_9STAP|nr:hypothetical protein SAMN05192557_1956 [Aliicoccus persicus]